MWVGFFCSSLIKANDGLSRSLYAHHRQTVGCNELLSGTWRISRKQAAGLVLAVLIAVKKKSAQHPNKERKKASQCPCPYSCRDLKNCCFFSVVWTFKRKKEIDFQFAKITAFEKKNTRQSEDLHEESALLFTCIQTSRVLGLEPCVFAVCFQEHSCNLIFGAKADKRRTEPRH